MPARRIIYFHRDLHHFTGGHLKMWDYFNHVLASDHFEPKIRFTGRSIWTEENPWYNSHDSVTDVWPPPERAPLFIGNMDWRFVRERQRAGRAIINLVQHPNCATPGHPHYESLSFLATRICVSQETADAIQASGKVNGPVHVIANGIDENLLPPVIPWKDRAYDILIAGLKRPDLARAVSAWLANNGNPAPRIMLLEDPVPRRKFLALMADARVAMVLARDSEGFYLPALEAMMLGCLTVCPDAIGNRGFCISGETCWLPAPTAEALADAALAALSMPAAERQLFQARARRMADGFTLARERRDFLSLLADVSAGW